MDATPNFEAEQNEAHVRGNPDRHPLIPPMANDFSLSLSDPMIPEALSEADFNAIKHGGHCSVRSRPHWGGEKKSTMTSFHCSHWTTSVRSLIENDLVPGHGVTRTTMKPTITNAPKMITSLVVRFLSLPSRMTDGSARLGDSSFLFSFPRITR